MSTTLASYRRQDLGEDETGRQTADVCRPKGMAFAVNGRCRLSLDLSPKERMV